MSLAGRAPACHFPSCQGLCDPGSKPCWSVVRVLYDSGGTCPLHQVCKTIRETDKTVPIIFISANSTEQDIVEGLTLGSNDYVRKPLSQGELIARVHSHLNFRETVEEASSNNFLLRSLPSTVVSKVRSGR